MDATEVKLGRKYRDKLFGIEGIATARTEHLTGCDRVAIEYVKEGEMKCHWVDVPQLEPVPDEEPVAEIPTDPKDKGGPDRPTPPSRNTDPRR